MAITLSQLQDYVDANIKQNGRNAITGNVMNYALQNTLDLLNGKQDALVSGTNIKTVNSISLLGSGDITISASAAGSDKQLQFNDGGVFGGNSNLLFDKTTGNLGIGLAGAAPGTRLDIKAVDGSTNLVLRIKNSGGLANIFNVNGKGLVWANGPGYVASNCAYGELALNANTTGGLNTAFGYNALTSVTTAGSNTAIGWGALQLTTGTSNTALGVGAGQLNASGVYNVFIGNTAGQYGTTANSSVFIGYAAGQNSNALAAICIGLNAGTNAGSGSIALGYLSGPGTGSYNLSIGQSAGSGMTTGSFNMHLGYRSIASGITTGIYNTLVGGDIVVGNVSNNAVLADMQGNQAIKKDANHNVVLGKETALATNATNGFAYLPTCAGTPTGVPSASFTGKAPVVIDSTNNKMYIYTNAAWQALN